ncbi:hypothetical protein ABZ307_17595 [Streptomyces griseorubiginosus]|uniref:hypothetical protein n=1 Tax=Streptomyces griseorubiginosus TaxID=67304 RepID=UPI0033AB7E14
MTRSGGAPTGAPPRAHHSVQVGGHGPARPVRPGAAEFVARAAGFRSRAPVRPCLAGDCAADPVSTVPSTS